VAWNLRRFDPNSGIPPWRTVLLHAWSRCAPAVQKCPQSVRYCRTTSRSPFSSRGGAPLGASLFHIPRAGINRGLMSIGQQHSSYCLFPGIVVGQIRISLAKKALGHSLLIPAVMPTRTLTHRNHRLNGIYADHSCHDRLGSLLGSTPEPLDSSTTRGLRRLTSTPCKR
jgi:hypothetical protein